jgi:hypothetical protein
LIVASGWLFHLNYEATSAPYGFRKLIIKIFYPNYNESQGIIFVLSTNPRDYFRKKILGLSNISALNRVLQVLAVASISS